MNTRRRKTTHISEKILLSTLIHTFKEVLYMCENYALTI